jgi:hypothetical protein
MESADKAEIADNADCNGNSRGDDPRLSNCAGRLHLTVRNRLNLTSTTIRVDFVFIKNAALLRFVHLTQVPAAPLFQGSIQGSRPERGQFPSHCVVVGA